MELHALIGIFARGGRTRVEQLDDAQLQSVMPHALLWKMADVDEYVFASQKRSSLLLPNRLEFLKLFSGFFKIPAPYVFAVAFSEENSSPVELYRYIP